MKKLLLTGVAMLALACSTNDDKDNSAHEYEVALGPNSVEPYQWTYVSIADGEVVGEEDGWDIKILRYSRAEMAIGTPFDEDLGDDNPPLKYMSMGPGGPSIGTRTDIVWSGVKAVDFAPDPQDPDKFKMPPTYLMLPPHDFLSADGEHTYRVQFTDYAEGTLVMTVADI